MPPEVPESDEERARKILAQMQRLEKMRRTRSGGYSFIWVVTLFLLLAVAIVFFANLPKFKLLYQMLTRPDSLLLR